MVKFLVILILGVVTFKTEAGIPYQAYIQLSSGYQPGLWGCSGALISNNYVLTTASCLVKAGVAHVSLGVNKVHTKPIFYKDIKNMTIHENYGNGKNDIALIKLSTPVSLSSLVDVIPIERENVSHRGDTGLLSGWRNLIGNLTEDQVKVNDCGADICSNVTYSDDCYIKGSLLVINNELVGITKSCGTVVRYTKLSDYIKWIRMHSDV